MSLQQSIHTAVQRLTPHSGQFSMIVSEGELRAEIVEADRTGLAFQVVSFATTALAGSDAAQLKSVGEALADQMRYLVEPICTTELDAEACTLQMRSNPPQKRDDTVRYFELLAQADGLHLRRYEKVRGEPRRTVPATVTREVFERICADLVAGTELITAK